MRGIPRFSARELKTFFSGHSAIIAAAVFMILTAVTAVFISKLAVRQLQATAQARFSVQVKESLFQINRRYESAVMMLNSARGLFHSSDHVTIDEFKRFIDSSGFSRIFPEFGSIGYITIVKDTDKVAFLSSARRPVTEGGVGIPDYTIFPGDTSEEYWPILYAYPVQIGESIFGNDQRGEQVRRANMEHARDIGDASISNDIILRSSNKPGAIIAVPIYSTKDIPDTLEERRASFAGAVAVSFSYDNFPLGTLPVPILQEHKISVSVASYGGESTPFFSASTSSLPFGSIYGQLHEERTLVLNRNGDTIILTFDGPAAGSLSLTERLWPFGIALTFIGILFSATLVILLMRRTQALSELRKQYEFISAISHQLRTPLSKARWSTEMLTDISALTRKEAVQTIRNDITTLISIVDDLLLFLAWNSMRNLTGNEPNILVATLIDDALSRLRNANDLKRIKKIIGEFGGKRVLADQEKLATALMFLIDNALTYSQKESPVEIRASLDGRFVRIDIIDYGIGIPKTEQQNIWEYFYRSTNAPLGKNAGSGVGVPLAKTIIKAHGGTIGFISEENKGTTFTVRLPMQI